MGAMKRMRQIRELPWCDLTCCSCWRCVALFYGEFFGLATTWGGMPCNGMGAPQTLVIDMVGARLAPSFSIRGYRACRRSDKPIALRDRERWRGGFAAVSDQ